MTRKQGGTTSGEASGKIKEKPYEINANQSRHSQDKTTIELLYLLHRVFFCQLALMHFINTVKTDHKTTARKKKENKTSSEVANGY